MPKVMLQELFRFLNRLDPQMKISGMTHLNFLKDVL
jgi:hypothetical protein